MDRLNFKSKFGLFNNKNIKIHKIKDTTLPSTLNRVNQNSLWLQSMEPIKYAKKYAEKLYNIENFKTEKVELDLFKKELFSNLKKQLSHNILLIKKNFLETSDGSLNFQ